MFASKTSITASFALIKKNYSNKDELKIRPRALTCDKKKLNGQQGTKMVRAKEVKYFINGYYF